MILRGARLSITGIHNTKFLLYKGRNSHRKGKRSFPKSYKLYTAVTVVESRFPYHAFPLIPLPPNQRVSLTSHTEGTCAQAWKPRHRVMGHLDVVQGHLGYPHAVCSVAGT